MSTVTGNCSYEFGDHSGHKRICLDWQLPEDSQCQTTLCNCAEVPIQHCHRSCDDCNFKPVSRMTAHSHSLRSNAGMSSCPPVANAVDDPDYDWENESDGSSCNDHAEYADSNETLVSGPVGCNSEGDKSGVSDSGEVTVKVTFMASFYPTLQLVQVILKQTCYMTLMLMLVTLFHPVIVMSLIYMIPSLNC